MRAVSGITGVIEIIPLSHASHRHRGSWRGSLVDTDMWSGDVAGRYNLAVLLAERWQFIDNDSSVVMLALGASMGQIVGISRHGRCAGACDVDINWVWLSPLHSGGGGSSDGESDYIMTTCWIQVIERSGRA